MNMPEKMRARPNWAAVCAQTDRVIELESALAELESRANEGWDRYRSEKLAGERIMEWGARALRERLSADLQIADLESRIVWYRRYQPAIFIFGLLLGAFGYAALVAVRGGA